MKTDLPALLVLCSDIQSTNLAQERAWDVQAGEEAISRARQNAESHFGADAAGTFGEWHPLEVMAPDTLQAAVEVSPFAVLRFTSHCEDGDSFELFGHCPACTHDETITVTNLSELAAALQSVGVR